MLAYQVYIREYKSPITKFSGIPSDANQIHIGPLDMGQWRRWGPLRKLLRTTLIGSFRSKWRAFDRTSAPSAPDIAEHPPS